MMDQQKVMGVGMLLSAPEPRLYPVGSSLKLSPPTHQVQREPNCPLVGLVGFLISDPFPEVLIKTVTNPCFFKLASCGLIPDSKIVFKDPPTPSYGLTVI